MSTTKQLLLVSALHQEWKNTAQSDLKSTFIENVLAHGWQVRSIDKEARAGVL